MEWLTTHRHRVVGLLSDLGKLVLVGGKKANLSEVLGVHHVDL